MMVFVVGNGESREALNVSALRKIAPVIGCNGLYRDYELDLLVSVDATFIKEVDGAKYTRAFARNSNTTKVFDMIGPPAPFMLPKKTIPARGWDSGSSAAWIACYSVPNLTRLILFGFDFGDKTSRNFNNIYKGTANYRKPITYEDKASFENALRTKRRWASHFEQLFVEYKRVQFVFVGKYSAADMFEKKFDNVSTMRYPEFYERELR